MVRVLTNAQGDLGSIPGRVKPMTQKMVLDTTLLNIQHYKVQINGKVEQTSESILTFICYWNLGSFGGGLLGGDIHFIFFFFFFLSQNEEEAFELRSQLEEIYQYWSVCL